VALRHQTRVERRIDLAHTGAMTDRPLPARRAAGAPASELVFCALGGIGEIGMNCYLYGVGPPDRREWLMVDLGITFPEGDWEPGVDVILPDLRYLEDNRIDLAGIVITHAHEDHIGALLDLWPRLRCPVYATPFATALLRAKSAEYGHRAPISYRPLPLGEPVTIGPFTIEAVAVAHSIPEPRGLLIEAGGTTVFHTGDWKIDERPFLGTDTDRARISAMGDAGIDAIVCDSTNALRDGRSPSESDVARSLVELVGRAKRAVAATIFSSNVGRIRALAEAAEANGRTLVVAGRSMHRMIAVAQETGHLPKSFRSVDQGAYPTLDPAKTLILCTGSQGEPRAAMARIAEGSHNDITLGPGDMVIFSSRTIPGNEKPVGRIQNQLIQAGCDLITDADALVHVTGHPRRDELRDMYAWVRPKIAIPVHGEPRHMAAHAKLAREAGVEQVLSIRNGDVVQLGPGPAAVVDEVPTGRLFRDGTLLVGADEASVRDRRKLAAAGIAFVSVVLDPKGQTIADPDVLLDGIPEADRDGRDMVDLAVSAVDGTLRSLPPHKRKDLDLVEDAVARSVRAAIENAWGKRPVVKCIATRVDRR
jgi:ribonuclease J